MLTIKILGSGCANCERLEQVARAAVTACGVEAEFRKVKDYAEIAAYGVMTTPGLVINEKVVSTGKIPAQERIVEWVKETAG